MSQQRANILTKAEFLTRNRLTDDQYTWLQSEGKAPVTIVVDGVVLISRRSERQWIQAMEDGDSKGQRRLLRKRRLRLKRR